MPRDGTRTDPGTTADTTTREGERLYRCAACGALVTRGRWEMAMDGAHERAFFNPAGRVFRVLCFGEAPGAATAGEATTDFTWFRGYAWRFALCRGCNAHLGWRYEGALAPPVFFGLIKSALVVGGSDT